MYAVIVAMTNFARAEPLFHEDVPDVKRKNQHRRIPSFIIAGLIFRKHLKLLTWFVDLRVCLHLKLQGLWKQGI